MPRAAVRSGWLAKAALTYPKHGKPKYRSDSTQETESPNGGSPALTQNPFHGFMSCGGHDERHGSQDRQQPQQVFNRYRHLPAPCSASGLSLWNPKRLPERLFREELRLDRSARYQPKGLPDHRTFGIPRRTDV